MYCFLTTGNNRVGFVVWRLGHFRFGKPIIHRN